MGVYRFGDRVIDPQKYPWGYPWGYLGYMLTVTIDSTKIDSNLTHFPLPIPLGSSVGTNNFNTQRVFDMIGSDYQKLRVTDSDGNDLYVEVEQWDAVNKKGLIWVSRDTWTISSTSDSRIFIIPSVKNNSTFVGTPGNRVETWAPNLLLRYGLQDVATGTLNGVKDSTSSACDGTAYGLDAGDAIIGAGAVINAESDKIELSSTIALPGEFEFSALLYINSWGSYGPIFGDDSDYNNGRVSFRDQDTKIAVTAYENALTGILIDLLPVFPTKEWALLSILRDTSDEIYIYINNTLAGSGTMAGGIDFSRLFDSPDNSGWNGMDDATVGEIRLSDAPVDAAWRKAHYYAQTDNLLTFE